MVISDTGVGIKPDDQEKIFHMLMPEREEAKNVLLNDGRQMGLGLFISK